MTQKQNEGKWESIKTNGNTLPFEWEGFSHCIRINSHEFTIAVGNAVWEYDGEESSKDAAWQCIISGIERLESMILDSNSNILHIMAAKCKYIGNDETFKSFDGYLLRTISFDLTKNPIAKIRDTQRNVNKISCLQRNPCYMTYVAPDKIHVIHRFADRHSYKRRLGNWVHLVSTIGNIYNNNNNTNTINANKFKVFDTNMQRAEFSGGSKLVYLQKYNKLLMLGGNWQPDAFTWINQKCIYMLDLNEFKYSNGIDIDIAIAEAKRIRTGGNSNYGYNIVTNIKN